jgi:hypothetical protein
MRLGLKAQSQCRATLETLAQIKNPPVVIARQANIAQGPQQVNNEMMPSGRACAGAGENEKPQNKLLEAQNAERLDFGTASNLTPAGKMGYPLRRRCRIATLTRLSRALRRRFAFPGSSLGPMLDKDDPAFTAANRL